jgi:uncharacterized membrane-anchored protein
MKVEVIKMNVNILGKGLIPGLKMLAPVRNVDLDQQQIARILKVKTLKVTLADSPDMITKNNLAMMFAPKTVSTEKVKKVEEKAPAEELIEKAEDLGIDVVEEETETPVAEEVTETATGVADTTDEMSLAEGLITEDTTYEAPVSNEKEAVEEAPTEEKTSSDNEIKVKKNKKNRHNK